ncbi:hypothetical protein ABPG75_007818 [Micractinium tetrahymenae]
MQSWQATRLAAGAALAAQRPGTVGSARACTSGLAGAAGAAAPARLCQPCHASFPPCKGSKPIPSHDTKLDSHGGPMPPHQPTFLAPAALCAPSGRLVAPFLLHPLAA